MFGAIVVLLLCGALISLSVAFSVVYNRLIIASNRADMLQDQVVVANAKLAAAERGFRNALKRGGV